MIKTEKHKLIVEDMITKHTRQRRLDIKKKHDLMEKDTLDLSVFKEKRK